MTYLSFQIISYPTLEEMFFSRDSQLWLIYEGHITGILPSYLNQLIGILFSQKNASLLYLMTLPFLFIDEKNWKLNSQE